MKKVMIVDDSRFVCEEIAQILADTEFEIVATCRDAGEAMETYHNKTPDVVLMDIVLPGIDGMEATEAMLQKWPDANIIMVTSLAYDDTIAHARKIGAKGFIFKPIDKFHLLDTLRQVIDSE